MAQRLRNLPLGMMAVCFFLMVPAFMFGDDGSGIAANFKSINDSLNHTLNNIKPALFGAGFLLLSFMSIKSSSPAPIAMGLVILTLYSLATKFVIPNL